MFRAFGICSTGLMRVAATACCLGATAFVGACGSAVPQDYPAFNLTHALDTERPGERP